MADEPTTENPTPPAAPAATGTFSQDDVNRLVTKEAKKAEERAAKAVREEVDAYLAAEANKAKQAEMSEIDRAKAEAAEARATAANQMAEAARASLKANVTLVAVAAGADTKAIADIVTLVTSKLSAEATPEDIAAKVEEQKATTPALFTPSAPGTPPPPGTPANTPRPPGVKAPTTGIEAGRELARQRMAAVPSKADVFSKFKPAGIET